MAGNKPKFFISRALPERSYLYFKYNVGNAVKSKEFYLPILENAEVSESQTPNYATYDLIGRPGNVFAYLGSKSRDINLKFKITLLNVQDYISKVGLNPQFYSGFRYFYNERDPNELFRREQKFNDLAENSKELNNKKAKDQYALGKSKYLKFIGDARGSLAESSKEWKLETMTGPASTKKSNINYDPITGNLSETREFGYNRTDAVAGKGTNLVTLDKGPNDVINLILLWVNVVRSSVVGNATNTLLGPPTVYLNHGTMYNNIPCICKNVSIKINDGVGFDLMSFTPRQVEITMSLSENRTSSFKEFVPFKYFESEGVAGWEAVVNYGTMDPYHSTFGESLADDDYVTQLDYDMQVVKAQGATDRARDNAIDLITTNRGGGLGDRLELDRQLNLL